MIERYIKLGIIKHLQNPNGSWVTWSHHLSWYSNIQVSHNLSHLEFELGACVRKEIEGYRVWVSIVPAVWWKVNVFRVFFYMKQCELRQNWRITVSDKSLTGSQWPKPGRLLGCRKEVSSPKQQKDYSHKNTNYFLDSIYIPASQLEDEETCLAETLIPTWNTPLASGPFIS